MTQLIKNKIIFLVPNRLSYQNASAQSNDPLQNFCGALVGEQKKNDTTFYTKKIKNNSWSWKPSEELINYHMRFSYVNYNFQIRKEIKHFVIYLLFVLIPFWKTSTGIYQTKAQIFAIEFNEMRLK